MMEKMKITKIEGDLVNQTIKVDKNYKNILDDKIFTGQQILNLLSISSPPMRAIILLSIKETDEPADKPKLRYGA